MTDEAGLVEGRSAPSRLACRA